MQTIHDNLYLYLSSNSEISGHMRSDPAITLFYDSLFSTSRSHCFAILRPGCIKCLQILQKGGVLRAWRIIQVETSLNKSHAWLNQDNFTALGTICTWKGPSWKYYL